MNICDTCGNTYEKSFKIFKEGRSYTFDSFECAIHKLAPACHHCECTIIGHGVEDENNYYCCSHCAKRSS